MAAYRRVYDSRHLQADCQEPGLAPEPFGNRVWATFTFFVKICIQRNNQSINLLKAKGPIGQDIAVKYTT